MIGITGANGLVGSFIVKRLVDEGLPVTAIVRANSDRQLLAGYSEKIGFREADVLDVPALMESFDGLDLVIHAAAMVSFNPRKARTLFDVNVEGTRNVVDACLTLGVPRLIHISSVAALGRVKGATMISEESKWVAGGLNSDYAESKYLAELEVYRGREEGLNVALVNPSVVLAPSDWEKSSARLFRYAWNERMFYTAGSLNYVDVRDVADMVHRIYASNPDGQKFIASAMISFKEFFDGVGKRFRKKPPFVKVGRSMVNLIARLEVMRSMLAGKEPIITRQSVRMTGESFHYDHEKAITVLGMNFHPLDDTLDWCCAHYLRNVTTNK